MSRCIQTDLLVEQCAHCKGDLLGFQPEGVPGRIERGGVPPVEIVRFFLARYDGRCQVCDTGRIYPGSRVGYTVDNELACNRCLIVANL